MERSLIDIFIPHTNSAVWVQSSLSTVSILSRIRDKATQPDFQADFVKWVKDHIKGKVEHEVMISGTIFRFAVPQEATLFKLTWGGSHG